MRWRRDSRSRPATLTPHVTHPPARPQGLSVCAYLTYLLVRANRLLRAEVARKVGGWVGRRRV